MNGCILKLLVLGTMLSSAMTLGACGGGDNPPTAVAEVITVKKVILRGSNAALKEVEIIGFEAKFRILEIRCAIVFLPPSNLVNAGLPDFVLLLDVAAADLEKTKAYGFSTFTSEEQARKTPAVCT
jgi:hypothetical protein